MPSIACCCVVGFVCVPVFPCAFLGSRVVCFVDRRVSPPVMRCLGLETDISLDIRRMYGIELNTLGGVLLGDSVRAGNDHT
jgi:hypothetical protein